MSNEPHCPSCIHFMHGHELKIICRRNGKPATPGNARECVEFVRDPGADDEPLVWFNDAWHVAGEGRGD